MNLNAKISENLAIVGEIQPISQAVGSVSTGWVSVTTLQILIAVISTGVLGSSATVSAQLNQATTSAGANSKSVTGKSITPISTNNQNVLINLRPQDLDTNGGFSYVSLTLTVATAASLVSAKILAIPSSLPADLSNDLSVSQIVA